MMFESVNFYDNNGECTYYSYDKAEIYEKLANDLLHKKIHKCTYIRSIKDECLYNGYRRITVFQDNCCKYVYVIKD